MAHDVKELERRYINDDTEWLTMLSDALDNAQRDNGNVLISDELTKEISSRIKSIAHTMSIPPT